jgi:HAD superfamily hydrolase (TIGR01509 family)
MLKAIIFDMDGVICDSEPLHMNAFQKVLQEEGIALTDQEYYDRYLAYDDRGCFTEALKDKGRQVDSKALQSLIDRKARYFDEAMKQHLVIYPGAESFIKRLADKFPLALASGARRLEVEFVLKKAKVRGLFTAIVSADDVKKGKPDPESFQQALKMLNEMRLKDTPEIKPGECLVIEDSIHGLAAAKAAGMKSAAVTTSYKADQLKQAALIIESMVGFDMGQLEKLFV